MSRSSTKIFIRPPVSLFFLSDRFVGLFCILPIRRLPLHEPNARIERWTDRETATAAETAIIFPAIFCCAVCRRHAMQRNEIIRLACGPLAYDSNLGIKIWCQQALSDYSSYRRLETIRSVRCLKSASKFLRIPRIFDQSDRQGRQVNRQFAADRLAKTLCHLHAGNNFPDLAR